MNIGFFPWFHILTSPYILIFLGFSLKWIYLRVIRHAQGVNNNPVINGGSIFKCPYIRGHLVELYQSYFRVLYGSGLASKEGGNRQIRRYVRRGLGTFFFFVNKKFVLFLLRSLLYLLQTPMLLLWNPWHIFISWPLKTSSASSDVHCLPPFP